MLKNVYQTKIAGVVFLQNYTKAVSGQKPYVKHDFKQVQEGPFEKLVIFN
jgi:hypothetical protein